MALKSSNKVDTNTYELQVTIDKDAFAAARTQAYMRQRKSIALPGFRKGKAPQRMIEKAYGVSVFFEDALEALFPTAVQAAIDEAELHVVDQPYDLDVTVMDAENGVEMTMKVTTYPEVKLGEYKGLKAAYPATDVSDEDIDAEIKRLQETQSRMVNVDDRAAKMGDSVVIDFEGFVDGEAFDGGKGEDYTLELGSGAFIPGFEEQIAGHNIDDEFDVNVTFPEEYQEDLAGKEAVFKCKLHEIKEKELPEIDDELAKDVDDEVETLDELKEKIKKQMTEKKEADAKAEFENALLEMVIDNMEAEIPECMNTQKTDELVQDYGYRLQMQGIDLNMYLQYLGQTMDDFKAQFAESAAKQVRVALALEAIAKAENIEVTEEEIDEEAKKLAEQYGMELDQIKAAVPVSQFESDLKTRKAVELIVDSAVKE